MTTRRAPGRRARGFLAGPRIVLALLLVLLALRTINLGVQDAYLDEGFHVRRSLSAWTFSEHPAHFAHGKLLLYYWLGLFTWAASGPGVIVAGRVAIALFSVVTGLTVYLLGRRLAGHASGVVALALYAVLPLTLYYERMAMADPLASGLAAVAVLSALGFARRPTTRRALMLGVLLALATMAKLSVTPVLVLPVLLVINEHPWRPGPLRPQLGDLVRTRLAPLVVKAVVVLLLWIPLVLPVLGVVGDGGSLLLFHPDNLSGQAGDATQPSLARLVAYARELGPLLADFLSWGFLVAVAIAALTAVVLRRPEHGSARATSLLLQWMVLMSLPVWLMATLVTARYAVPLMVPTCLLVAVVAVDLWRRGRPRLVLRGALVVAAAGWAGGHVIPFTHTMLTAPHELPFRGTNAVENVLGFFQADDAVRSAAETLNRIRPDRLVVSWRLYHLLFPYLAVEAEVMGRNHVGSELRRAIATTPENGWLYLAIADYAPFYEGWDDVEHEVVAVFERPRISRPVSIVRLRHVDGLE